MLKRTVPVAFAFVLGAGLFVAAPLAAGQRGAKETTRGSALTARDYLEIQQLVARSSYALDSVAENGDAYARLFTADGVLRTGTGASPEVKGRDKLAAFARADVNNQGPLWVHSFVTNHIIQASPQGATGRVYVVGIEIAEGANPGAIQTGGALRGRLREDRGGMAHQDADLCAVHARPPRVIQACPMPAETVVVQAFRPAVSGRPEGLHYFRRFPTLRRPALQQRRRRCVTSFP